MTFPMALVKVEYHITDQFLLNYIVMFQLASSVFLVHNKYRNFRDNWVSLQRYEEAFNVCCPCQQLKTIE